MAVKMTSPLMFGPGCTDLREGINIARMREERAARMKQVLKQAGVPAVLVTGVTNVRYLTGFVWSESMPHACYALFFAEEDAVIFAQTGSYHQMPDQMPWIKHWRLARAWFFGICGAEAQREEVGKWAKEIREELEKRGLAGEKLGVIEFDEVAKEGLKEAGLTIVDAWPLLLEASKIKTRDEINCFKMAASICSTGWQRFINVFRVGMTVGQLRRQVVEAMEEAGAELGRCDIVSGPFTFERNVTWAGADRRIEYGETMYIPLCGTKYLGYPACLYRSFIASREPTAKENGWYKRVKDTLDAAMEATKPGNTTADAAKAFPPASKWGYSDEVEVLTVEFGHGLGMPMRASPTGRVSFGLPAVNRQWSIKYPQPFEKGMVIAYESLEGERRVGGARLEDMVVVTDDGCEMLDFFPRDEIIVVGVF